MSTKGSALIKTIVTLSFLAMVLVNLLANIIPINDVETGDVSEAFENLFAPAGFTFAIWGVIYISLAGYTVYQLGLFHKAGNYKGDLLKKVGVYFTISSIANILWIFAWHYYLIGVSMVLMVVILVSLILIYSELNQSKLDRRDRVFLKYPFSIYFGWITVATIANVFTLMVSVGWDGLGLSGQILTAIAIIIGLAIAVTIIKRNKDILYGLVIIGAL
ncbi:tryptophan-rich sensory protein [Proteinivorax hydrogeniformans]|uniref:Tryptophan-rich sensory protein n=1 Tax=Proteinivorax hydrogeniformans TaxID=1826727 RepID=A0AAU8HUK8_9FIRM